MAGKKLKLPNKLLFALSIVCLHLDSALVEATPSSTFWTVCTTDVLTTGVLHLGVDDYFTVFNERGHGQSLPTDVTIPEYGLFTWCDVSAEAGIDYLGGTDDPLFFNAKIGLPEDKLFKHAPAVNVGLFNIGTHTTGPNRTKMEMVYTDRLQYPCLRTEI